MLHYLIVRCFDDRLLKKDKPNGNHLPNAFNPTGEGFFVGTGDNGRTKNNHRHISFQVPDNHLSHGLGKNICIWPTIVICPSITYKR